MTLLSKHEAAEKIAEAERVLNWVCLTPADVGRTDALSNLLRICKQFVLNDCVDPHHNVVPCYVCGCDVHTCEREEPSQDGDFRCPVHPDGVEIDNGEWVCSLECYDAMEEVEYIKPTLKLAFEYINRRCRPSSFVEYIGHPLALLIITPKVYFFMRDLPQYQLRQMLKPA